jgi:hypothetical protein
MFLAQQIGESQRSCTPKASIIAICVTTISLMFCMDSNAFAQELWRGASVGMNQTQVQTLFPDAVPSDQAHVANGVPNELHVANLEIAGAAFGAEFYFRNDALSEIILDRLGLMDVQPADARTTYEQLREEFTRTYGPPTGCQTTRNFSAMESCQWGATRATITLISLEVQDQPLLLKAIFRKRSDRSDR